MSKLEKTIKLKQATFEQVAEFLNKKVFHAQNPTDSLRKCDSPLSFNNWKSETLFKYPESVIVLTKDADWFNEVRVSDPVFQEEKTIYQSLKASFLEGDFYGG